MNWELPGKNLTVLVLILRSKNIVIWVKSITGKFGYDKRGMVYQMEIKRKS